MKQALLVCVLGGVLAISNGCCAWRGGACGPCGPCGTPDCGPCDAPCAGPACGPGCGPFGVRGAVTYDPGDCDGGPCDDCGPCGSCGPYRPWGPFFWFPGLFGRGCAGCGERYWGVWSDRVGCDPCDRCGNWTGSPGCGCGGPNGVVGGPVYAGDAYARGSQMPAAQITQTVSPRPQYAARPQQYGPQQHASPQTVTRPQQYAAGAMNVARPQYVQRTRQHTGQPQYASQPRIAPRAVSEADQVFDPTITDPAWQTTQQPVRALSR